MIVLADHTSPRERGLWQGLVNIMYAAGTAAGAPIGASTCTLVPSKS